MPDRHSRVFASEDLLPHLEFMRGVARGLLGDSDRAEDLVQDTCLTALTRPPGQPGHLGAWLRRVSLNFVRQDHRSDRRRKSRELETSRRRPGTTFEEIRRQEAIRKEVVATLLALPEADRDLLILRYYDQLPPRKIAARLGIPVETVRTRIKRALAKMRRRLDENHGGEAAAWRLALIPMVAEADSALVTGMNAAATGGVSLLTKWIAAGAAALLLGLAWLSWPANREESPPPDKVAGTSPEIIDPNLASAPTGAGNPEPAALGNAEPSGRATSRTSIAGRTVGARSGGPIEGIQVALLGMEIPEGRWEAAHHELDMYWFRQESRGKALFEGPFFEDPETPVDTGPLRSLEASERRRAALGGARWIRTERTTGSDGEFSFDPVADGLYLVVARPQDGFVACWPAVFRLGAHLEKHTELIEHGIHDMASTLGFPTPPLRSASESCSLHMQEAGRIVGHARGWFGETVAHLDLFAHPRSEQPVSSSFEVDMRRNGAPSLFCQAKTDAHGWFVLEGVRDEIVLKTNSTTYAMADHAVTAIPGEDTATELQLLPSQWTFPGKLLTEDGHPVPDRVSYPVPGVEGVGSRTVPAYRILAFVDPPGPALEQGGWWSLWGSKKTESVEVDSGTGRFAIRRSVSNRWHYGEPVPPSLRTWVVLLMPGLEPKVVEVDSPDDEISFLVDLEELHRRTRWVRVSLRGLPTDTSPDDVRFAVRSRTTGAWIPAPGKRHTPHAIHFKTSPDPPPTPAGCRIDDRTWAVRLPAEEAYDFAAFVPGAGHALAQRITIPAGEAPFSLTLDLEREATWTLDKDPGNVKLLAHARVPFRLHDDEGRTIFAGVLPPGGSEIRGLAPGRYHVTSHFRPLGNARLTVELAAGDNGKASLRYSRTHRIRFTCPDPPPPLNDRTEWLDVVIRDEEGRVVTVDAFTFHDELDLPLGPGLYRYVVSRNGVPIREADFRLLEGREERLEVELRIQD